MSDPQVQAEQSSAGAFAGWTHRVAAYVLDALPVVLLFVVLTAAFGETETSSSSFAFELTGVPALVYFAGSIGWFVYNWLLRQGRTGQTVGKKIAGITVLGVDSRQPIGPGLTFARQLVHVVDGLPCLIGYLWPIWDREKRTFSDMIMSTRVFKV